MASKATRERTKAGKARGTEKRATKRPGRPAFEPTDEQRKLVEAMVGYGIPQEEICLLVTNPATGEPIARSTLNKCFAQELQTGGARFKANVVKTLYRRAVRDGHVGALIWLTKTRLRWSERHTHEHSGPDGGPIELQARLEAAERVSRRIDRLAERLRETEGTRSPGEDAGGDGGS